LVKTGLISVSYDNKIKYHATSNNSKNNNNKINQSAKDSSIPCKTGMNRNRFGTVVKR
jgi:hypothetical protein